jgi:hypothetical protein
MGVPVGALTVVDVELVLPADELEPPAAVVEALLAAVVPLDFDDELPQAATRSAAPNAIAPLFNQAFMSPP